MRFWISRDKGKSEEEWKDMEQKVGDLRALIAILEHNFQELSLKHKRPEAKEKP
jgi:hypothetical protein